MANAFNDGDVVVLIGVGYAKEFTTGIDKGDIGKLFTLKTRGPGEKAGWWLHDGVENRWGIASEWPLEKLVRLATPEEQGFSPVALEPEASEYVPMEGDIVKFAKLPEDIYNESLDREFSLELNKTPGSPVPGDMFYALKPLDGNASGGALGTDERWWIRKNLKDAISYLKFVRRAEPSGPFNDGDDVELVNVLGSGIDKTEEGKRFFLFKDKQGPDWRLEPRGWIIAGRWDMTRMFKKVGANEAPSKQKREPKTKKAKRLPIATYTFGGSTLRVFRDGQMECNCGPAIAQSKVEPEWRMNCNHVRFVIFGIGEAKANKVEIHSPEPEAVELSGNNERRFSFDG